MQSVLGCTGVNHGVALATFQNNFNRYIVTEAALNRTYNATSSCYWSVRMRARIGHPFVWSKLEMKNISQYYHIWKPAGLEYVGVVESKQLNNEGATAFFRVASCQCGTFFQEDMTTFPNEGKWLNRGTHVYIHVPEFTIFVKEHFLNLSEVNFLYNEDELSDSEDEGDPTGLLDCSIAGLVSVGIQTVSNMS